MSDHTRRYLQSAGADGHIWRGAPTLVLTTTGRRTGQPRSTALIYGRDGDQIVVVASKRGALQHPWWYLNLIANPEVGILLAAERFTAIARTATPDEKPRLWQLMAAIWPSYLAYQKRTKRAIPVVLLTPCAAAPGSPPDARLPPS